MGGREPLQMEGCSKSSVVTTGGAGQMICCLQAFFAVGNVAQATLILGFLCVNLTLDQKRIWSSLWSRYRMVASHSPVFFISSTSVAHSSTIPFIFYTSFLIDVCIQTGSYNYSWSFVCSSPKDYFACSSWWNLTEMAEFLEGSCNEVSAILAFFLLRFCLFILMAQE